MKIQTTRTEYRVTITPTRLEYQPTTFGYLSEKSRNESAASMRVMAERVGYELTVETSEVEVERSPSELLDAIYDRLTECLKYLTDQAGALELIEQLRKTVDAHVDERCSDAVETALRDGEYDRG